MSQRVFAALSSLAHPGGTAVWVDQIHGDEGLG